MFHDALVPFAERRIIIMKKRIGVVAAGIALVIVIAIVVMVQINNAHKVVLEDETMAELIAKNVGVESVDKLRIEDLEKIEILNIGYTGYYDTLVDIEKCPNLKRLIIGYPQYTMAYYAFVGREMPAPESKERVKQIEKELESILEKCPDLEDIYISNEGENCKLDNIEFLKKGKNLGAICLFYQSDIDYSVISECTKLQFLSLHCCDISDLSMIGGLENLDSLVLTGTNVSEATDILKLKNLSFFRIADTPLAENEEQLNLIQKQFPELKIETEY